MHALTVKLNSQNWHIFWKIIGKGLINRDLELLLFVKLVILLSMTLVKDISVSRGIYATIGAQKGTKLSRFIDLLGRVVYNISP